VVNKTVNKTRAAAAGVAAIAVLAALGACGNTATNEAAPAASTSAGSWTAAQAGPHNRADMRFAHMMIRHHQQAVEMSDIILAKPDIDPRVVELATRIKAAQGPEIEQMQGWMSQWGMPGMGGMHHGDMKMGGMEMGGMEGDMEGMMSPADMDELENAQGVQAGRLFLTQMIAHHEGAVTMAQKEITDGESPEAIELAKSIAESQQQEIDLMNGILSSL